jgi:tetratricopeptide (TPR) repeat protein
MRISKNSVFINRDPISVQGDAENLARFAQQASRQDERRACHEILAMGILFFSRAALILGGAMIKFLRLLSVLPMLGVAACASLESQSEFLSGRRALLRGEPENALSYFDKIARTDPAFVAGSVSPQKSIWTYVGRAHYNSGRYDAARPAFEKALAYRNDDHVARLYLGLTLVRPSAPVAPPNAFSLQEVIFALREGVEPKRMATLARGRGIAFDVTKESESQLRTAGADNFLLNELRSLRVAGSGQTKSGDSGRAQGAKELRAGLSGLLEWLNDTVRHTPQGKFWDPSQEIRNQIAVSLKQTAGPPADWDAVIANVEWIGFRLEEESDRARRDESAERDRTLRR